MGRGKVQGRGDPQGQGEMRVRFLVNKANSRILYMEAGKNLVDMLLGFLHLPVATILSMYSSDDAATNLKVGCVSNIYEGLQKLSNSSLVVSKEVIMHPPCAFELSKSSPQLLLPAQPDASPLLPTEVFRCNYCSAVQYVSWVSGENCPSCGRQSSMTRSISLTGALPPASATPSTTPAVGYVQRYLSFIVTNDLSILPAYTIESIVLLNKLSVEKMSDLDSFESSVTANEALELLKISFTSKEALNSVFGAKIPGRSKRAS